jgi:hypothetical protein
MRGEVLEKIQTQSGLQLATQKFTRRSHDAVIRVYDDAGNVIDKHEHTGDFTLPS